MLVVCSNYLCINHFLGWLYNDLISYKAVEKPELPHFIEVKDESIELFQYFFKSH